MTGKLFGFIFDTTEVCKISNVNFSSETESGTCKLISNTKIYLMTWSITNYPMETAGMPGSPYPIKISYSICEKTNSMLCDNSLNSISGEFIYEIHSGTFPDMCALFIKHGIYQSSGFNNKTGNKIKLIFNLTDDSSLLVYMFSK